VLPSSSPGVGGDGSVSVVLDFDLQTQFASLHTELLQLVADRIEEVIRPLRDEAAAIKLWLARAAGSWERAEVGSTSGVGCAPVQTSDDGLMDAKLFEIIGPFSPVHRVCGSPPVGLDDIHMPPECSSGPSPLLSDAHEDNVASFEVLHDSFSDVAEGFLLAEPELFVEAPVDHEVADSTKLCAFLANLALKKKAPMSLLQAPLEEIPTTASVVVPSAMATEGIQVDPKDPVAVKRNAFLSLVSRPLPPPILAMLGPRRTRAPMEVATTPRRSCRIEKQRQKRKDGTTQELLTRTLGLLEENAEFDDNVLAAFSDKFKTPLSPRAITMLGSLVKKMEKVKKPKGRKVDAKKKKKASEIT
jgi:hypothetical protein